MKIKFIKSRVHQNIFLWALFDWAYSAFATIITTFIFAPFFVNKIAINTTLGTAEWGYATGIAGLCIALLSPLMGVLVDQRGSPKRWLMFFTLLCILSTSLLWFANPQLSMIYFALALFILASVSYELCNVLYNGLLPRLVPKHLLGRVSGWAWGFGYLGGLFSLIFCFVFFINEKPSWLDQNNAEEIRICAPFVGLWITVFALPLIYFIQTPITQNKTNHFSLKQGLRVLWQVFLDLIHAKNISLFLLAKMLYTDGINTIVAFGGIYAVGSFGMEIKEVLIFGIALNITAGLGAASFAWMNDWIGAKKTILFALIGIMISAAVILITTQKLWFWILALAMGLFFGPSQSASRSLMAHLAPEKKVNEMFGLFALSGKITAYANPLLLSAVTLAYHSQRIGMSTILFFLLSGFFVLLFVKE